MDGVDSCIIRVLLALSNYDVLDNLRQLMKMSNTKDVSIQNGIKKIYRKHLYNILTYKYCNANKLNKFLTYESVIKFWNNWFFVEL